MNSDYYQLLSRMIEAAKNDPAVRRNYVYELARIQLLKFASTQTPPWSNTRILQELQALDAAVTQVELFISEKQTAQATEKPEAIETKPAEAAPAPEPLPSARRALHVSRAALWIGAGAALVFTVAVVLVRGPLKNPFAGRPVAENTAPAPMPPPEPAAAPPAPSPVAPAPAPPRPVVENADPDQAQLPVPDRYGVFLWQRGQLTEMTYLLPRQPGRGAEAVVVEPSRLRTSDGNVAFIVRQREFVANPPRSMTVSVVARIAREIVMDKGKKTTTPLSGLWVLRNIGSEFRAIPIPEHPDTVLVQPDPPHAILPAGRYVLEANGEPYDFSVEGSVSDPAHCVERTATLAEDTYQQCPSR